MHLLDPSSFVDILILGDYSSSSLYSVIYLDVTIEFLISTGGVILVRINILSFVQ